MADLFVGTAEGVYALSEKGGWSVEGRWLEDAEVAQLAREPGGTLLVATRGRGLLRLDPKSGAARRLGETSLPERVRCAAAAGDGERIYAGTEPVGIFRSDDGGRTWQECRAVAEMAERLKWGYPVPTVPPHIRDIAIDPGNPDRLAAAVQVGAVIVSDDAGRSWRHIAGQLDADVHCLAQDPADAKVLYASAGGGGALDMQTLDRYPPPLPEGRPLYRSADFGRSWECISLEFERTYGVQVRVDPADSNTLIAGVGRGIPPFWARRPEGADAVILVSRDRGRTWTRATGGLPDHFAGMVEAIAFAGGGRSRAYIGTGGEGMKRLAPDFQAGLYVSERLDRGWSRIPVDVPSVSSLLAA